MVPFPPPSPTNANPNVINASPSSVLFICNFNAVRSPMAEILAQHFIGRRCYVKSAGIRGDDDQEVNPFCVEVLQEMGLDLSQHRPQNLDEIADSSFDLIISLTPEAQHKAVDLTRSMACDVEYWPTMDPTLVQGNREVILTAFREARDQLAARIKERFDVMPPPQV